MPYLMENIVLIGEAGWRSFCNLEETYQLYLYDEVNDQIKFLPQRTIQTPIREQPVSCWEGGKQWQYLDWQMIEKSVFDG